MNFDLLVGVEGRAGGLVGVEMVLVLGIFRSCYFEFIFKGNFSLRRN